MPSIVRIFTVRLQAYPNKRLLLAQAGILVTFALIPVWYRFPGYHPPIDEPPPLFLPDQYFSYFFILLPMIWSIFWWLVAGLPGFKVLRHDFLKCLWALCFLLLALWAVASNLWAFQRINHPDVAQTAALQFIVIALFVVVTACAAPSTKAIVGAFVLDVIWNAILIILQVANQGSIGLRVVGEFPMSINQPGISYIEAGNIRWLRPYGLLPHPNPLGGFMAIGLLACVAWIVSDRRRLRWLGTVIFPLGLWGLLLTFSRSAWIGFAAGGFVLLPLLRTHLRRPEIRRQLVLVGALALVTGAIFFVSYRQLLAARTGEEIESVELRSISDRMVFTELAYRSIDAQTVFGVGIGNFPWRSSYYLAYEYPQYQLKGDNVHQVFLSAWAELGIVGFGLMVAALVLGVEAALHRLRHSNAEQAALLAGFAVLLIVGLFDHYPWTLPHFQIAWWGCLALAARNGAVTRLPDPQTAPQANTLLEAQQSPSLS